jgi:hypothetical protein
MFCFFSWGLLFSQSAVVVSKLPGGSGGACLAWPGGGPSFREAIGSRAWMRGGFLVLKMCVAMSSVRAVPHSHRGNI